MIFFGHLGLTGLAARITEKNINHINFDYRLVLIGSILPDLIDKPIGRFLFDGYFNTGRIFAHTFVFVVLLSVIGLFRWVKYKRTGWLVLAGSCFLHDIFDSMWLIPQTLLWPFLGLKFSSSDDINWILTDINSLMTDPWKYGPEIVGLIITIHFIYRLAVNHELKSFIRSGLRR